jgi:hypothetical protein
MQRPIPPLNELKYTQHGLHDLRQHLGVLQHGVYNTHRPSFDAADIAWIATTLGLASSTEPIAPDEFPPELATLREGMSKGSSGATTRALMRSSVQKLVFNAVSCLAYCRSVNLLCFFFMFLRLLSGTVLMVVRLL